VEEVITANHFRLGIGKERKSVSGFAAQVAGDPWCVNADGDGTNAGIVEFTEIFLYAS